MRTLTGPVISSSGAALVPSTAAVPPADHSSWHSPVPYLFGGLAAMMGLIAFALLILACSYWRLSGYLEDGAARPTEAEAEDGAGEKAAAGGGARLAEGVVVIMAGDVKPTFLATPISFGASYKDSHSIDKENEKDVESGKNMEGTVSIPMGEQSAGVISSAGNRECDQHQDQ